MMSKGLEMRNHLRPAFILNVKIMCVQVLSFPVHGSD